ncbi:unnamed protein product [Nyctereutes procyonoides]|uniref:(raccoon dog) hypothetical protein n=1 Tax=Nyctereutes procyonoides TaxID=34880 RepID=A0A811ZQX1_NYCPR|nr:unnamed protein product [Nyctereutes procyonoides]
MFIAALFTIAKIMEAAQNLWFVLVIIITAISCNSTVLHWELCTALSVLPDILLRRLISLIASDPCHSQVQPQSTPHKHPITIHYFSVDTTIFTIHCLLNCIFQKDYLHNTYQKYEKNKHHPPNHSNVSFYLYHYRFILCICSQHIFNSCLCENLDKRSNMLSYNSSFLKNMALSQNFNFCYVQSPVINAMRDKLCVRSFCLSRIIQYAERDACRSNTLNIAIDNMCKKTRDLRRQVANLACSMSTNEDGIKIVKIAANHLETLCPQSHILEDVNKCIIALRDQDADNLDRAAGAIRGRAARVAHIVTGEMDSYEPGAYTEGVMRNAKMTQLPEAEKEKIAEQVADFKKVKSKLDAEIEIWDDTSNDIIVLAKKMCMIMMEMTDFTRGKGPLKHTTDVIYAAKMISESGSRMDVLARQIANQCPDPSCKQDLLAYLEQIKFYSHQLKICSQVKAEIQNLGGELIMSALDSVTSLIQAAKNLMNAVVQTVKMSYIASTKIIRIQSPAGPRHPVVMWRMKAPAKKPLIKREKPEETCAAVRRGSAKKKIHPVQVMSEFRGRHVY